MTQSAIIFRLVIGVLAMMGCFAANAADRRGGDCGKVDDWMQVIGEWGSGKDFNRLAHEQVRQLVAPVFHDDVMREVWGDAYESMSGRQRSSINKALNQCSGDLWVKYFLTIPFSDPPDMVKRSHGSDYQRWQAAIQSVNSQPYQALKAQRQQQIAMQERAVQMREEAKVAAQARKEQNKRMQEERARQAEAETASRVALVDRHAASGPFRGSGGAYLNALYANDREALAAYDRQFASAFTEGMSLYKGSAPDALARLFLGEQGSDRLNQQLQNAAANLSMVTPVAGVFVLYYEHVYPQCMDEKPLVYKRTREYEWVTRNNMGTVLSRSPAWSVTDEFRINHRYQYVWEHMGDIEKGNAAMVDLFLGKPGAIRLADAMGSMSRSMHQFACDSPEIRQLESNMLDYFQLAVAKMNRATK